MSGVWDQERFEQDVIAVRPDYPEEPSGPAVPTRRGGPDERDLLERLREHDDHCEPGMDVYALCLEAAQEIERLRAQVAALEEALREAMPTSA